MRGPADTGPREAHPAGPAAASADGPAAASADGPPSADGRTPLDVPGAPALPPTPATGLSDAEAATRRAAGLGNPAPPPTTRTYARIVRENVFTFINNVLFALGIALVVVGRPMDALVSLGVISTNIVVSVVQEVRAKRTLDRIALLTAPTATVVRDGVERAVPPSELVVGDLVAVGPGDQVVVDGVAAAGRFRADESQLTGESDQIEKVPGAPVFSGSFCVTGSGRYVVETVGAESVAGRITAGARSFRRVLTPLQRQINLVIRLVLLIVVYLEVVLLVNAVVSLTNPGEAIGQATILAGLIPNGLFVSIAIAYALGAVRISRFGALVQQANAIESLSNVDVLCLDKTGTLTTNELTCAEIVPVGGASDVRAILGTVVASQAVRNKTSDAIAAACPAAAVPVAADVPFSSARKWSAVVVADGPSASGSAPALSGTYALGAPQMLRPYLPDDAWEAVAGPIAERADQGLRVLLLVHGPEVAPIADDDDAVLPAGMRVLAIVVLRDVLRPDAAETLARFRASGVSPKVISGDDPATVSALARQVGLGADLVLLSGAEVDATDDASLPAVARATDIFGRITPAQKERLVGALRRGGAYVAMIGDGVNDVLSLKRANVAVAMQSGSQATRGVADIVLMNDSFSSLAPAVEEGQRIVNGMQGILALFLTRIATLGALIVSALIIGVFPVALRNASAITFFTVGIPSVMLALWARPGALPREGLARTLVRFVVPAAAVTSLVGLVLLYGTILLRLLEVYRPSMTQAEVDAILAAATPAAQSAVTALLVFTGLALVVFIQPPIRSLAVVRRLTPDRRPTYLAIVLAAGFVVTNSVSFLRNIFALQPLREIEWLIVALAFLVWLALIIPAWRFRVVERFLGSDGPV